MKKYFYYMIPMLVLSLFLFTGCSDDDDDDDKVVASYELLTGYLEDMNRDLDDILTGWITSAEAIQGLGRDLTEYYIIDIRSTATYATGHIPGAVNCALTDVLDCAAAHGGKPILVTCYTGQSAGHAVAALRLMGYEAQNLMWGMSSWNSDFDFWTNNTGDAASGYTVWESTPNFAADATYDAPNIESTETAEEALLAERVQAMLDGGFQGVTNEDVLSDPGSYFINLFWSAEDAAEYGHISGAHRIKETLSIGGGGIDMLDPGATIVTYCWTGQTSSIITAYLTVLGFDAKSLRFGANGMIYSDLNAHKWIESGAYDTAIGSEDFSTMTDYMLTNGMDLTDVLSGWITTAEAIQGLSRDLGDYHILDIRDADDYDLGHIPGAINCAFGDILDCAATAVDPILVVCYTGQSAGHAVVALRLSGYSDAAVLKWGMSSWNADFDRWTNNTGDAGIGHANWTYPMDLTTNDTFAGPSWDASATDGAGILAERVLAMLEGGFKGIAGTDVIDDPGSYFINNYWGETDVATYGHITGAYRIKEDLTLAANGFRYLDPEATVVTYCWTGQTSSIVTAYLTVLGYDAQSLKFGVNSLIYSNLAGHTWVESGAYPYE